MSYLTSVGNRTAGELLVAKLATFGISSYLATDVTHSYEPITPVDVYADAAQLESAREIISVPVVELVAEPDEYTDSLRRRKRRVGLAMLSIYLGIPVLIGLVIAVVELISR